MWGEKNDVQAVLPAGAGVTREGTQDAGEVRQSAHMAEGYTHSDKRCHALNGWSRWWWASALVILLAVLGVPSAAYASESWGTVDGPFVTGQTANNEGYVVINVTNKYDAALCAIGRGSDKIQLTNEQFAKLSNASTGGRFYEFASSFFALGNDGSTNWYVGWWGDTLFQANMVSLNGGYGHVWAVETNSSEIASALEDYLVIYNGGNLGGGSGGTHDGNYAVGDELSLTGINAKSGDDAKKFRIDNSEIARYMTDYSEERSYVVLVEFSEGVAAIWSYKKSEARFELVMENGQKVARFINISDHAIYVWNYAITGGSFVDGIFTGYRYYGGVNPTLYHHTVRVDSNYTENVCNYYWYSGDDNVPSVPPTNWPDAPTPEPIPEPTVPEPSDVDIDVTFPSLSVIIDNDFTADLQGVLDAMDEHCQHLQRAIYNGLAGLFESLKEFEEGLYTHYVTYIHDVLEWLQDWFEMLQSDMDKIDIDISAINRYLYRILQEIGSNDGNATDVTGIESQLDTIIARLDALLVVESADAALDLAHFLLDLLGELLDTVGSVVSGVTEAFGDLTEVFPFSIPWDIAAIAALFAAEPVTPAFDIPFPAIAGGEGTLIHVDLSDFDGIASVGRAGILILFATGLALRTPQLMGVGSDDVA